MGIGAVSRPAVFLDRDGVLVEELFYPKSGEREAPWRADDVRLLPDAANALRRLAEAGYALVLISNQAAFAKGKTTLRDTWLAHERFAELLAAEGVKLDGVYYSYGHPEGVKPYFSGPSLDRKPNPYNLFVAAAQLDLDLARSWMIGDRETDVECAHAAGVKPILLESCNAPSPKVSPLARAPNLREATAIILADTNQK
jgi:D-glycero-D-manno-heptose 1,7-bisphosphate phosphatase